jgi:hypothetical protein
LIPSLLIYFVEKLDAILHAVLNVHRFIGHKLPRAAAAEIVLPGGAYSYALVLKPHEAKFDFTSNWCA